MSMTANPAGSPKITSLSVTPNPAKTDQRGTREFGQLSDSGRVLPRVFEDEVTTPRHRE